MVQVRYIENRLLDILWVKNSMEDNNFTTKTFNSVTGSGGEDQASKYLISKGYKILKRNFKTKIGEIDIVAKDGDVIVFVEVKTRKNDYFGLPREAVTPTKQRKIRMVATQYLKLNGGLNQLCRFDVIDILGGDLNHIENCF